MPLLHSLEGGIFLPCQLHTRSTDQKPINEEFHLTTSTGRTLTSPHTIKSEIQASSVHIAQPRIETYLSKRTSELVYLA